MSEQDKELLSLTGSMFTARDHMKMILGNNYPARVKEYKDCLLRWKEETGKGLSELMVTLAQHGLVNGDPIAPQMAAAAYIDLTIDLTTEEGHEL